MDIHIRPIRPDDKRRLQAGLDALSPETVRQRFLSSKDHLSQEELRYLTEVDMVHHIALVAEDPGEPDRVIAVVRCVRHVERPDTAEVAYVVADDYHGQGLATRMLRELAELAARQGIERFIAIMAPDNEAARALVMKVGPPLAEEIAGGVRELVVAVPRPRRPRGGARPPRRTPRRRRGRTGIRRSGAARPMPRRRS